MYPQLPVHLKTKIEQHNRNPTSVLPNLALVSEETFTCLTLFYQCLLPDLPIFTFFVPHL